MTTPLSYAERITAILRALKIPETFAATTAMPLQLEAADLVSVGVDIYGRDQRLTPDAAQRWKAMQTAAESDGVSLLLVSAFRSVEYQLGIWERKLVAGKQIPDILAVSAPPGYSEHHTGRAIDLTTSGCAPVTEEFEQTKAFEWLVVRAGEFGFAMTYPRGNRFGVDYEPWHWSAAP